jgi:hypothetical protein
MEVVKSLFALRALPLYLLAALPLFVISLVLIVRLLAEPGGGPDLGSGGGIATAFALVYQFILRLVLYGGCVWIFVNLFRGEVLDRSLHYYFLAPVRREVLVAGKFAAGWVAATTLFGGSALLALAMLHLPLGTSEAVGHLLAGPGLVQLVGYATVSGLACLGYGALFCLTGLVFRNPVVPAIGIWLWEAGNPFMPALLKKFSVVFYLNSLLPVPIESGPLALLADPVPAWLAVPGLLLFTLAVLVLAGLRIRKMEIAYAD